MKKKNVTVPTIGMPMSSLYDPYQNGILTGIQHQISMQQARILCFAGGAFSNTETSKISENALYKLISPENVDMLILISGCLGTDLSNESLMDFLNQCPDIPAVSIGIEIPEIPSIVVDNSHGMHSLVSHMAVTHGCKRIAFIKGPSNNEEAVIRFTAYKESLKKHQIPFDPDLVCPGDYVEKSGIDAVRLLLDEKKISFDALIGVDDLSVLGAAEELKRKGFTIPDEIKIGGFDDMEQSFSCHPPLTTIRQPLFQIGNLAAKSVLSMLNGNQVPQIQTIPTKLVIRRSCGCPAFNFTKTLAPQITSEKRKVQSKNDFITAVLSEIEKSVLTDVSLTELPGITEKLEILLQEIMGFISDPQNLNSLRNAQEDLVQNFFNKGFTISLWEEILKIIGNKVHTHIHSDEKESSFQTLLNELITTLYLTAARLQTKKRIDFESETEKSLEIGDRLFACFNLGQIKQILKKYLPLLDINECYFSLYEEDTSKSTLLFSLQEKSGKIIHLSMFSSRNLIPEKLPSDANSSYAILPLINESEQIGFILFKLFSSHIKTLETLTEKISRAINAASLIEQIEQQNAALRETENEDLRNTLNSIGDAVIATDSTGKITKMNPEAEKLTGWKFMEVRRRSLMDILKINNPGLLKEMEDPVETIIRNGHVAGIAKKIVLTAKNGEERQINYSGAPIRDSANNIVGVVLVLRDISEFYRMEKRLLQAQKMDSIGQLAGGIAHDFNNMLAGITSAAEIIALQGRKDKTIRKHADLILETTQSASDLTQKLLAFSQKAEKHSTEVNVHSCIRDAVKILKHSIDKRVKIKLALQAGIATLIGDPSQIQNIILNLGINAQDAMPSGGKLTISTNDVTLDENECSSSQFDLQPGSYIEITTHDTGTGMKPETLAHIFEPFFTTKEIGKGTGLGLAAVYGMVKDHHGSIQVSSQPQKGTVFTVFLPTESLPVKTEDDYESDLRDMSGCILVVDDEQIIRRTLENLLKDLNFEVILANNGKEAVEIYRKKQNHIDLVILDMRMPEMNGYDAFKAMKKINPKVKVLLSSGYTQDADMDELQEKGAIGFIQKPYRRKKLTTILVKSLKPVKKTPS